MIARLDRNRTDELGRSCFFRLTVNYIHFLGDMGGTLWKSLASGADHGGGTLESKSQRVKECSFFVIQVLELDSHFGSFHIPVFRNLQRVSPSKINLFVSTSDRKFRIVDDVDTQIGRNFCKAPTVDSAISRSSLVFEAFSKCQVISWDST